MNNGSLLSVVRLMLTILVAAVFSWIIVHIMAFFGLFIAVGHLLWIFFNCLSGTGFSPNLIILFRGSGAGETASDGQRNRKAGFWRILGIILINVLTILVFTAISYFLVSLELRFIGKQEQSQLETTKSISFDIPQKGQYKVDEIFPVPIRISGIQKPVNIVQADLSFDPDILEAISVSTSSSFANIFVQKEVDNTKGYIRLTGGLPNPGYMGKEGSFGTIYFKAKASGVTKVDYLPTSLVLLNDGKGSNALAKLGSIPMVILPEAATEQREASEQIILNSFEQDAEGNGEQLVFFDDEPIVREPVTPKHSPSAVPQAEPKQLPVLHERSIEAIRFLDSGIFSFWERILSLFN